jgi:hypothetical protein
MCAGLDENCILSPDLRGFKVGFAKSQTLSSPAEIPFLSNFTEKHIDKQIETKVVDFK